jgi:hypothetical protein
VLDHDAIKRNRIMISSLCLSMIFSENRFPLFRIMLSRTETALGECAPPAFALLSCFGAFVPRMTARSQFANWGLIFFQPLPSDDRVLCSRGPFDLPRIFPQTAS